MFCAACKGAVENLFFVKKQKVICIFSELTVSQQLKFVSRGAMCDSLFSEHFSNYASSKIRASAPSREYSRRENACSKDWPKKIVSEITAATDEKAAQKSFRNYRRFIR